METGKKETLASTGSLVPVETCGDTADCENCELVEVVRATTRMLRILGVRHDSDVAKVIARHAADIDAVALAVLALRPMLS